MATTELDQLMERASVALARTHYLECEALCQEALQAARQQEDWDYYARILLPLQEARRQRRQIAADGTVRLGTADLTDPPEAWLERLGTGCLLVTRPHGMGTAQALLEHARRRNLFIEVLFADSVSEAPTWRLRSFAGPAVSCQMPAPPAAWRNRWVVPGELLQEDSKAIWPRPADWFVDATEALGDAALAQVQAPLGDVARVAALERSLQVVSDHEFIHQRLAEAAKAM